MSDMMVAPRRVARRLARVAMGLLVPATIASVAHAQGLSYDMKTSGTGIGRGSSDTATRVMTAAHGQFSNGKARLDVTQSPMVGGMMGQGTYMLASSTSSVSTFVDPAKRQYFEIDRDDLAKTGAALQGMTSGLVKTDVSDVAVTEEALGPGEAIEGYATAKYRITDSYTMSMSIMGHNTRTTEHSTTDLWIAPKLDGIMNPMSRQAPAGVSGPMAALTTELTKAYAKIGKGIVLRTTRTSLSETGGKQKTMTMTTEISNIKQMAIGPAVFVVPADYTKVEGLGGQGAAGGLGALGAIGDSLKAARAAASQHGSQTAPPSGESAASGASGTTASPSPNATVDSARTGATQGAVNGAKQAGGDAAANQAKKVAGKLFGRP